ncbi:hypothetical protein PQR66_08670 [Paraburkholderia agricolaris]|uniref:Uncharacterized protein n=1 Tax=Paraburkholderia agricolaris TaxID=2152888 RepID=A0ABW8ZLQ7_9BURK
MAKRNQTPPTDAPVRIVAVFLVIVIVIAGAKMGSRMNRSFAQASGTVRITASGVASLQSQYNTQSSSIVSVSHAGSGRPDGTPRGARSQPLLIT